MRTLRAPREAPDPYPSRLVGRPIWSPRREPVVHSPRGVQAPLSEAMLDRFEQDGFVVIDGLFSADEVRALQTELERLRADPCVLAPETLIQEPGADEALRTIFAIHTQSALFRRLSCDARLVELARYILGDEVYIHQSRLNYKPGFDGKEFYWHSDFETWRLEDGMARMQALSMSLLLNDNTPNNGPLMLIPGSHKHFVGCVGETPDEHYKKSLRKQEYGVPDRESLVRLAAERPIEAPIGKAGSLVIFDCNTMHGSNGNITPSARANAFIVYNAVSNALGAPVGGTRPRPTFVAARGTPKGLAAISGHLMDEGARV